MSHSHKLQAGFTLLEVIVVLVITSIITTILMQGLSVTLNTKLRFESALTRIEEKSLQRNVISTPLTGLIPDYSDGDALFRGSRQQIRGLTLTALQGAIGAPTKFQMTLDYDISGNATSLIYAELGYDPVQLARWQGDEGEFLYRGRDGNWLDAWPPQGDEFIQAPRTIRIDTGLDQRTLFIQVMGPHQRPLRVQDMPFGSTQ